MISKYLKRKLAIFLLVIGLLLTLYFFPKNDYQIPITSRYVSVNKESIYLLNTESYVSRVLTNIKSNDLLTKVREKISYLTIDSNESKYLPNNFVAIIPKNTSIIDLSISDTILKINFSKELLNISKNNEVKLIEAITYSLTDNTYITGVMIFVEGNIMNQLPHSKKVIPTILTRKIGINKVYDITSYKDTYETTIYYLSKYDDYYYYIPVTLVSNDDREKIEIIINELTNTPLYQTNLISYLKASTKLLNYEILENQINLSFNKYIFDDFTTKKILEEVKYSINLSINDNYNILEVNYYYDDILIN